ncbi:MAG TPA: D-galactarate dehydratase [Desulfobacteraceae bacterium]|jgi:altronate dehydratase small subunit|nr:D-galactarate dehydratase [Desulfobacteraceae bacterium]
MRQDAIMISDQDNVATALKDLEAGQSCQFLVGKDSRNIKVKEKISFGHKFAVVDIVRGMDIIKYGEVMGRATADIPQGHHAHVQNIESLRGRGDLKGKGVS